jgi:hypothetical protein
VGRLCCPQWWYDDEQQEGLQLNFDTKTTIENMIFLTITKFISVGVEERVVIH